MNSYQKIVIITFCLFSTAYCAIHHPQVYEEVNENPLPTNNRISKGRVFSPWLGFNYSTVSQRDQLRRRYLQQQQVDFLNFIRSKPFVRVLSALKALKFGETTNKEKLKSTLPNHTLLTTNEEQDSQKKIKRFSRTADFNLKNENNTLNAPIEETTVDPPNSDFGKNRRMASVDDKDDLDMEALNTLIGKSPVDQLEGLKKILQNPNQIFPKITQARTRKRYTPLSENTLPASAPPIKPVVVVAYSPSGDDQNVPYTPLPSTQHQLMQLQAQLDSLSQAKANEQMKEAQEEALTNVQAQHAALAAAQREAYERMKAINAARGVPSGAGVQPIEQPLSSSVQHVQNPEDYQQSVQHIQNPEAYQQSVQHIQNPEDYQQSVQHIQNSEDYQQSVQHVQNSEDYQQSTPTVPKFLLPVPHPLQINSVSVSTSSPPLPEEAKEVAVAQNEVTDYEDQKDYASNYAFGYQVQDYDSSNNFGHAETSNGNSAKGHYHVQLPDGRIQHVEYTADASGFHAKVTYSENA